MNDDKLVDVDIKVRVYHEDGTTEEISGHPDYVIAYIVEMDRNEAHIDYEFLGAIL